MSRSAPTKPRLSREAVLDEAMAVLDERGLDGLTMRNLGDRLQVVPMALYRHVRNKDDLLDGVLDRAVSLVPLPAPDLDWRDGLAALARSVRATMLEHPAVVAPVVQRPSLGPSAIALGEYGFSVMRGAGFSDTDSERGLNVVLTYTLGFVALEVPRHHAGPGTDIADLDVAYDGLPIELYPHTAAVRPSAAGFVSEEQFDFGLECILDGIGQLPHGRRRRARATKRA